MKTLYFLIVFCCSASFGYGQEFLNGSFEISTATDCKLNINNASYNSYMSNVKGIGVYEKLDIFYDTKCSIYGLAQDGHYYCSLENPVDYYIPTALSFELTTAVVAGKSYTFYYYDKGTSWGGGAIDFGVSATDTGFGTLIHTQPDSSSEATWIKRKVTFTAPITGKYITARYGENRDSYIIIDNFAFEKSASIREIDNELKVAIFPNPSFDELNISVGQNFERPETTRIFNQFGQLVYAYSFSNKMDISSFPAGIYLLEIKTENKSYSVKFSKQ
ncbi:MAG: T9SS type A sorting domain-containing protein [Chitinophagaceae bacterium]|jgi:hypothetical protein